MGYKDFAAGAVLTATDVDTYLASGPACVLTKSSTQNIGVSSDTAITWNQEDRDDQSMFSSGSAVTTTVAGLYLVVLQTAFASTAATSGLLRQYVVKTGTGSTISWCYFSDGQFFAASATGASSVGLIPCDAGDTLTARVLHTASVTPQVLQIGDTRLTILRVFN